MIMIVPTLLYSRAPHDFLFNFPSSILSLPYIAMQAPTAVRGYSDFFKSGFRAFTRGAHGQALSSSSQVSLSGSPDTLLNTFASTPGTSPSGATKRPFSMIVQNTPSEKARRRRSSLLSLSSPLFDNNSVSSSSDDDSPTSSSSRSSIGSLVFDSGDALPEVWITAGGPYTLTALNGSSDKASFDYPSSFNMSQDSLESDAPKRDSFLSFTSSSNRSSIIITRRERPSSMPPLSSRRSSFQYHHHHSLGQEKSDFFWVVEEETEFSSELTQVDHEDLDAPAKIDWRQFHVDILTTDV